jgi:uncharacterized membrane protein
VTERRLRLATVALGLAGALIAAYLSYTRVSDTSIMCPTSGCATVQRSSYSELGGVPVAYLGLVGYLAIVATAHERRASAVLVVAAAAFAGYLLYAQLVLIDAVCAWCLASDGVLAVLLVMTSLRAYEAVSPTGATRTGSASS